MLIIACIKPPLVSLLYLSYSKSLSYYSILNQSSYPIPIPMLIIACIKPPLVSLLYLSYSNNPYPYVNYSMY